MRTNLTHCLLSAVVLANLPAGEARAQITNGGFEDLNSSSLPRYWQGDLHLLAITIDSNGVYHVDSVVYDGGTDYALSTDAHSGQYAMELRNGYNYTQQGGIVGRMHASADTTSYQGFPIVTVPVTQRPLSVGFWAKYAPLATDSAEVIVVVLDGTETTIGTGLLTIGQAVTQYTAFEVPIVYTSEATAMFMQLTFSNARYEGGTVTLGTRFLIDDVNVTFAPDGVSEQPSSEQRVEVFPLPSDATCTVRPLDGSRVLAASLIDAQGRAVGSPVLTNNTFDTSALRSGSYVLNMRTNSGAAKARVLVNH